MSGMKDFLSNSYIFGANAPFIEGLYVEPGVRKQGIGRALAGAAETHARREGHFEIASDAELDNDDGVATHKALGYSIIERVVCFRKPLRDS